MSGAHGKIDAIQPTRHLHVGEQDIKSAVSIEKLGGFVTVPGLGHLETLVLKELRSHHPDNTFVLDKQDPDWCHQGSFGYIEQGLRAGRGIGLGLTEHDAARRAF